MICAKPPAGNIGWGCGQCIPCRVNRRRVWASRIILESYCHPHSSFVTLTYSDDYHPSDGSLDPGHLQGFLKRLRKAHPDRLRFFAVGEYGTHTLRPHYHLILFNLSLAEAPLVDRAWGRGFVQLGDVTWQSASYVAGYTMKPRHWLPDRRPEFSRMSLRPGIGALALDAISTALQSGTHSDAPLAFNVGRSSFPLGRYLRAKIRSASFTPAAVQASKDAFSLSQSLELQALLRRAQADGSLPAHATLNTVRQLRDQGRINQVTARHARSTKGTL